MIVIDTSVILKCFFPESGTEKAKNLIAKQQLAAPDLMIYEFSNFLGRQKSLTSIQKQELLELFYQLRIEFFILPQHGFQRVLELSEQFKVTSYDASFIALAETLDVNFITADQKLKQQTRNMQFIKLL